MGVRRSEDEAWAGKQVPDAPEEHHAGPTAKLRLT